MKIVTVIPLAKGTLKGDLTYFTTHEVGQGDVVTIPLRGKKILGLVVSAENARDAKIDIKDMDFNLKKIVDVKEHSVFSKEYIASTLETSEYFLSTKSNTIASLVPAVFRERYDELSKLMNPDVTKTKGRHDQTNIKSEKLILQAPTEDRIAFYKTLIRGSFAEQKSIFIVLPNEREIETFQHSLSKGIEQFTFGIHGGLGSKKTMLKFGKIVNTSHPILILGTAPFLCIPRLDLGTVVIEHESTSSYKLIAKPHIDLRTFVEIFASKINVKLILSDTLLRYETIGRQERDHILTAYPPSYRLDFSGKIGVMRPPYKPKTKANKEGKKGSVASTFRIFSDDTIKEIRNTLTRGGNVFLFTLRKGLATQTICRDCGETMACDECKAPLVLYHSEKKEKRIFVCNRCQKKVDAGSVCATCGSWNLVPLGIGVDTVLAEIESHFPKGRNSKSEREIKGEIFKLEKGSVKTQKEAEKIVANFEKSKGSILVGTEMALLYLKNKVDLTIVASFDTLWSIPNYKMGEKVAKLIITIISMTNNKLIIQTKNEEDPTIRAVRNSNLLPLVREELKDREELGYPPFKRFIKITYLGNKEKTIEMRKKLGEMLNDYNPEIFSGFMTKLKGKYTTNALIKMDPGKWSLPALSPGSSIDQDLSARLSSLPAPFEILVDPEDLL